VTWVRVSTAAVVGQCLIVVTGDVSVLWHLTPIVVAAHVVLSTALIYVAGGQLTTGAVQYSTGLPIAVVAVHLLGAAVTVGCAAQLQIVTRAPRTPAARGTLPGDGVPAGHRIRTSGTRA
jgi:hypothetical protein